MDEFDKVSEDCQENLKRLKLLHTEMQQITNRLIDIKAEVDRIRIETGDDNE